jgi:hypothetical protein
MSGDLTLKLVKILGSPFLEENLPVEREIESRNLYILAVKNKIPLLYLEAVRKRGELEKLDSAYKEEKVRYQNLISSLSKISKVLNSAKIDYCIVKTIRPFPSVPGDVDILILGDKRMFKEAIVALLKAGFVPQLRELVDVGALKNDVEYWKAAELLSRPTYGGGKYGLKHISPTGTDLVDVEFAVDVDLQRELALSYVVYLDKRSFFGRLTEIELQNGAKITVPIPELDLTVMIAHSLMEQMFLLGEFYTLLYRLYEFDDKEIENFVRILRENRLVSASRSFLTISAALHQRAFGILPEKMQYLLDELGYDSAEEKRIASFGFKVPHKYGLQTVLRVFLEKTREKNFMKSLCVQALKTLNPKMARLVLKSIIDMRKREYYLKDRRLEGEGDG